jgi:hypothetical protein
MPGFIVNTNRAEESDDHPSERYMLTERVALVTGEDFFRLIDTIEENDMVFLYANKCGIIARGIATGESYYPAERFCGERARCMRLREFEKLSRPIQYSELPTQRILNRAVVPIPDEEAQRIWDIASGRL